MTHLGPPESSMRSIKKRSIKKLAVTTTSDRQRSSGSKMAAGAENVLIERVLAVAQ
jgi:hypothetical protein